MSRKFGLAVLLWCAASGEHALASVSETSTKTVDAGERTSVAGDNRRMSLAGTHTTECDGKPTQAGALTKLLHRVMGTDAETRDVQCPLPDAESERTEERSDARSQ